MKALAWLVVALAIGQGGRVFYEDKAGSFRVSNYSSAEGGFDEDGTLNFEAKGNPLLVESRLQGLAISGPFMSGSIGKAPDPKDPKLSVSFIKSLLANGNPVVRFNSTVQHEAALAHAEKYKLTPPDPLIVKDQAELKTVEFKYEGSELEGTFSIPKPFTLTMKSQGKKLVDGKAQPGQKPEKVETEFKVDASASGASGTVLLNPSELKGKQLQTGNVEGRIQFDMVQEETSAAAPTPKVMTLHGEADRMEFDLKTANTVTLIGNVKLKGDNRIYEGTSEGDRAVITLDPKTMEPIKIRLEGEPTKMVAKKKSGGGR